MSYSATRAFNFQRPKTQCTAATPATRKPRLLFVPEDVINKVLGRLDVESLATLSANFPACTLLIDRRALHCSTAHNNQRQECALSWIVSLDAERNC